MGEFMKAMGFLLWSVCFCCAGVSAEEPDAGHAVVKLRGMVSLVFKDAKSGEVTEVVANGNTGITNEHMKMFALFPGFTDLSLEGTRVSSEGLRQLQSLK